MHTRQDALTLLHEYTAGDSLRKHALSVEAAMVFYAKKFGEDEVLWGNTGLLHDFDYEQYPDPNPDGHPYVGSTILADAGWPEEMRIAILGHAHYTGVPRTTPLAKALFACDELCGLITAAVCVRPDRSIHNLELSSIRKKMKDKAFARGVNRDDIINGAEDLGVPLDEHIQNVLSAMRMCAGSLGLE